VVVEHWPFDDAAAVQLKDSAKATGTAVFTAATASATTNGSGSLGIVTDSTKTTKGAGTFLSSTPITIGNRNTGTYEMEFLVSALTMATSGGSVGFAFRDTVVSSGGADVFRVRVNKTATALAVSSFIDGTYTTIKNYTGSSTLAFPLKIRSVIDLDAHTANVYLTEGANPELPGVAVTLSTSATTWSNVGVSIVNNTLDWGASDSVGIDYLKIRKLNLDSYALWRGRTSWQGQTLTAEADDPDGDGICNFMEFALGGNPLVNDQQAIAPHVVSIDGVPNLVLTLGVDSVDLNYQVQFSTNLQSWTTIPPVTLHGQAGTTFQVPIPNTGQRLFWRLLVTAPQ
jgi:hypothetical protein